MARYNTFVATLSIFESLILKQIDLCSKTIITHFIIIVPLKCGILQGLHPSANISPVYQNEKKRMYASRVMAVEQATFTPLVFTTRGGMAPECQVYHKRLAEPLSAMKREDYSTTTSWIRTRISLAFLRTSLLCLRGLRSIRRVNLNLKRWTLTSKEDFSF